MFDERPVCQQGAGQQRAGLDRTKLRRRDNWCGPLISSPRQAVILSEALRRSITNKGFYSAESKDLGDACWQMLLGAFRPQTIPEDKKVTNSGEAEGSAVPRTSPGNAEYYAQAELSSRLPRRAVGPGCTRISCHAALETTACAAFSKESRMKIANATKLNRKSGVAQWRDLRFSFSSHPDAEPL
jgi:hypothetical protein